MPPGTSTSEPFTDAVRIVIGGDVVPGLKPSRLLAQEGGERVFGPLEAEFKGAQFTIVNLECPLVDRPAPVPKPGPHLHGAPAAATGLRRAGIQAVGLANNHILDHGREGLESTLAACARAGLATVGAGPDVATAGAWLIRQVGHLRIAFCCMAEHEASIATDDDPGANPLDLVQFCRAVRERRGQYDKLVVLLHGGAEFFPLPSPRLRETCRFLVEQGAAAVVCQHSHIAGAWEVYQGAPISYGQGNLLAEATSARREWHTGYLVVLTCGDPPESPFAVAVRPFVQSLDRPGVRDMTPEEEAAFQAAQDRVRALLADPRQLQAAWREHCVRLRRFYFGWLKGYRKFGRRLNGRLGFAEHLVAASVKRVWLNQFTCETHREAIETLLRQCLGERDRG